MGEVSDMCCEQGQGGQNTATILQHKGQLEFLVFNQWEILQTIPFSFLSGHTDFPAWICNRLTRIQKSFLSPLTWSWGLEPNLARAFHYTCWSQEGLDTWGPPSLQSELMGGGGWGMKGTGGWHYLERYRIFKADVHFKKILISPEGDSWNLVYTREFTAQLICSRIQLVSGLLPS